MYLKKSPKAISLLLVCATTLLTSCGSDDSSTDPVNDNSTPINDDKTPEPTVVSGILVDPFISGAILCEDKNKNGTCEPDEPISTETDAKGNFQFEGSLTAGSHISIKQQGFHNNVPYTLKLGGVVDSDGKIDIVSPLTTLQTKDLNASQIKGMLEAAGLDNLSEEDIFANPIAGGINSLDSDDKLKRLHASLATYSMLKILKGSTRLNELTSDEFSNSTEVISILTSMVEIIKESLSHEKLAATQQQANDFNQSGFTAPDVSINVITQTAITIIDTLTKIGYDTCNQTDGTDQEKITAALEKLNANKAMITGLADDIGMQYYARENKTVFEAIPSSFQSLLPDTIKAGMVLAEDKAIVINLSNDNTAAVVEQSTEVANIIMSALADKSINAIETFITECPSIFDPDSDDYDENANDEPHFAAGLDCDDDGGVVAFSTPRNYKVSFKSLGLINEKGEKVYLINKDLDESVVFDITELKDLGNMTIPAGTYTSIFAQIYYYWFDMEMIEKDNYMQMRVYMSDDDFQQWNNGGHHQGDLTKTDANNNEIGFFEPGSWYNITNSRTEPEDPNISLYASTPDQITGHQRGPFGGDGFWDIEATNPNDIYTISEDIPNFTVEKESKIQLTFTIKNSWFFEDFGGQGIYDDNSVDKEIIGENGSWAPLIALPKISIAD